MSIGQKDVKSLIAVACFIGVTRIAPLMFPDWEAKLGGLWFAALTGAIGAALGYGLADALFFAYMKLRKRP